jgi:hypothetical protein
MAVHEVILMCGGLLMLRTVEELTGSVIVADKTFCYHLSISRRSGPDYMLQYKLNLDRAVIQQMGQPCRSKHLDMPNTSTDS